MTDIAETESQSTRAFRISKSMVSAGSGLVLSALLMGFLGGIFWGVLRPMQQLRSVGDGRFAVLQESMSASFIAVLWFVGIAIVVGLVLGIGAFRKFAESRNLGMELWVGFSAALSSVLMFVVGQLVAGVRQSSPAEVSPGEVLGVIPAFDTYATLVVAPLLAMCAYWVCLLFDDSDPAVE